MSFRLKTILGIGLIEALLLSSLLFASQHYLQESNEEQIFERAQSTARLLATMTADSVVATDLARLDALVKEAVRNRDVVFARVRDAQRRVLAVSAVRPVPDRVATTTDIRAALAGGRLDAVHDITIDGTVYGTAEIGISADSLRAILDDARQWALSIALAEIVLVAVFGFLLGTILTRRLAALQAGARRVAAGEFGYQLPIAGRDELGSTAMAFNSMSRALADYSARLEGQRADAEARRAIAELTLHAAVEGLPQSILVVGTQGQVLHANASFVALLGKERGEIGSLSAAEVGAALAALTAAAPEEAGAFWKTALADGGQQSGEVALSDGRNLLLHRSALSSGGFVLALTDISTERAAERERAQLQRRLLEASNMESLGTLAAGVAHEINTPIQFIGDNLRFIADGLAELLPVLTAFRQADDPRRRTDAEAKAVAADADFLAAEMPAAALQSLEGVAQVAHIVRAVKMFAHPGEAHSDQLDVNAAIETAATVTRNQWKVVADLHTDLAPDLPRIRAVPGEINQVLLNLIDNAAQAIGGSDRAGKGRITITSRRVGEDRISVAVADNGPGVPEGLRHRIFDMFFTTKPPGHGTGQGLAICQTIVEKNHGGSLRLQSPAGGGASFEVILPVRRAAADGQAGT